MEENKTDKTKVVSSSNLFFRDAFIGGAIGLFVGLALKRKRLLFTVIGFIGGGAIGEGYRKTKTEVVKDVKFINTNTIKK